MRVTYGSAEAKLHGALGNLILELILHIFWPLCCFQLNNQRSLALAGVYVVFPGSLYEGVGRNFVLTRL